MTDPAVLVRILAGVELDALGVVETAAALINSSAVRETLLRRLLFVLNRGATHELKAMLEPPE